MGLLKKVIIWRFISVFITLVITWLWSGSLKSASGITIVLQAVLLVTHWVFEDWWLKMTVDKILAPEKNPFEKPASGRKKR